MFEIKKKTSENVRNLKNNRKIIEIWNNIENEKALDLFVILNSVENHRNCLELGIISGQMTFRIFKF
jgi:hypothetical protein